jgi:D-amino-acid oxidase
LRLAAGVAAVGSLGGVGMQWGGSERSVGVIGAGVVGLHVARVFAEHGYAVTVYAARVSPGTTSDVPWALIFPHLVPPTSEILRAIQVSNEYYESLRAADVGVHPRTLYMAMDSRADAEPELLPFSGSYRGFAELAPSQVPGGYRYGWRVDTYWVDTRVFMPYLMNRVLQLGATVMLHRFASRDEMLALPHAILANCTGLGARDLLGDEAVYPVKGQVVTVNPVDLRDPILHDNHHIFPRPDSAVLGGTQDKDVWDLTPSEDVTREIVEGNRRIVPSLRRDQVIDVRTGLRPFRDGGPRLEAEIVGDKLLLHNYGHGGSGWTIAPGCAELVFGLV